MTRKSYRVKDGVNWVNGARVPSSRIVRLTEREARYDLDHGRIAPATPRWRRKQKADKT